MAVRRGKSQLRSLAPPPHPPQQSLALDRLPQSCLQSVTTRGPTHLRVLSAAVSPTLTLTAGESQQHSPPLHKLLAALPSQVQAAECQVAAVGHRCQQRHPNVAQQTEAGAMA